MTPARGSSQDGSSSRGPSTGGEEGGKDKSYSLVRRAARLAAVQALYQIEIIGAQPKAVTDEFLHHRLGKDRQGGDMAEPGPGEVSFDDVDCRLFEKIVSGVSERQGEIDSLITPNLSPDWSAERMQPLLFATLRAAAYELLALAEVPPRVVINEYLDITHAFFEAKEAAFVNAVLDRLAHQLRAGELESPAGERESNHG